MSKLAVATSETIRLLRVDLHALGVDLDRYGERDYERTQEIGSTLAWLGFDGLIAPSARWGCENLMIFTDNHKLGEKLEVLADERVEWQHWARMHGIITDSKP